MQRGSRATAAAAALWLAAVCLAATCGQYIEQNSSQGPKASQNYQHHHRSGVVPENRNSGRNAYDSGGHNSQVENIRSRSTNRKSQEYGGQMIFPGEEFQRQVTRNAEPQSNCPYGLCENVHDYPLDKIKNLLDQAPEFKQFFDGQILNTTVIEIGNRGQFDGDEGETFCATRSHISFPQKALNLENVQRTVVNVNDTKQGIVYETCVDDNKPCRYADVFSEEMYVTSCKQKYSVRTLLVLGEAQKNLTWDHFKIPSCCVCHIKRL